MASTKSLKQRAEEKLASGNATQLGDPVSLKAETSDNVPTKDEEGAKGNQGGPKKVSKDSKQKSLKELAKETNPSMLGDPISLKAETSDTEPTDEDRGALRDKKQRSKL